MEAIERVRRVLEETPGVRLAVLFGSAANQQLKPGSDIDVGVLLDPGSERSPAFGVALDRAAGRPVDLIWLDAAPPLLRFEIAREGLVLDLEGPDPIHLWHRQPRQGHATAVHVRRGLRRLPGTCVALYRLVNVAAKARISRSTSASLDRNMNRFAPVRSMIRAVGTPARRSCCHRVWRARGKGSCGYEQEL